MPFAGAIGRPLRLSEAYRPSGTRETISFEWFPDEAAKSVFWRGLSGTRVITVLYGA